MVASAGNPLKIGVHTSQNRDRPARGRAHRWDEAAVPPIFFRAGRISARQPRLAQQVANGNVAGTLALQRDHFFPGDLLAQFQKSRLDVFSE